MLPADPTRDEGFDCDRFAHWIAIATDPQGVEHAVLSDGYRRIRLDVDEGSLARGGAVLLRYRVEGIVGPDIETRLAPVRRLAGLLRTGRFLPALFPRERRVDRLIEILRVSDALSAGASQREIAAALFGSERVGSDWRTVSDSLRSRVRRLVRGARRMRADGYRRILHDDF